MECRRCAKLNRNNPERKIEQATHFDFHDREGHYREDGYCQKCNDFLNKGNKNENKL